MSKSVIRIRLLGRTSGPASPRAPVAPGKPATPPGPVLPWVPWPPAFPGAPWENHTYMEGNKQIDSLLYNSGDQISTG